MRRYRTAVGIDLPDVGGALSDVFDRVPGSGWAKDAVAGGAGWLGDFAKTPLGQNTLRAINGVTLYPATLAVAGPLVAFATFATPGMIAGEPFTEAYAKEATYAVERIIKLADERAGKDFADGVAKVANDPDVRRVTGQIADQLGSIITPERVKQELARRGLQPSDLARKLGVREDAAGHALDGLLHQDVYTPIEFDPKTGARVASENAPPPENRSDGTNSAWTLLDWLFAERSGAPPEVVAAARQEYEATKAIDDATDPSDDAEILIQLLRAQQREADPAYVGQLQGKYDRAVLRKKRIAAAEERSFEVQTTPLAKKGRDLLTVGVLLLPALGAWWWTRRS